VTETRQSSGTVVYYTDADGDLRTTSLCNEHAEKFFRRNPGAFGCGERGGECVACSSE
jgi:hypothetical protein